MGLAQARSTMRHATGAHPKRRTGRFALQRPARQRFIGVAPDFGFRHAGVVLERQRGDRLAIVVAATDAAERDDRADIGAAFA